jgi:hypothetical protein
MKRSLTGAIGMVLCCSAALAGPLKTEQVAGEAVWVAHLDAAALLKSGIGKFILQEAQKKEGFLEGMANIRQTLGFDPLADVRGVTLYGKKLGGNSGVVILDATTDQDKILALLKQNQTYQTITYGDYVLHQWTDPPKTKTDAPGQEVVVKPAETKFGTFYDEKTVLVASSLELLKGAVDVMNGKADSLAKTGAIPTLPKPAEGVLLTIAAEKIEIPAKEGKPNPFKSITDVSVQVGELQGAMFLHAQALAETAEKGLKLRQIVQGFIALGQVMMQEQPDLPVLGEKIQVGGAGNAVQIDAEVATDSLIKMIQFLAARKQQAAQAAGGAG